MGAPLKITYEASVTSQQKAWFADALSQSRFPLNRCGLELIVRTVFEPPAPGHADYMATRVVTPGVANIYIRERADDPTAPFNAAVKDDLRHFFMESVIHELGHAFVFSYVATDDTLREKVSSWFVPDGEGHGLRGTLADWNALEKPWAERTQEAIAEFFKDVYLPEQYRVYDNRSAWVMDKSHFGDFLDAIEATICPNAGSPPPPIAGG